MSKIRTREQFVDFITADIAGRKKELAVLFSTIRNIAPNSVKSQAMIRSGVTVLYAHWEGFIKLGSTAYLEFISRQDISYKDLKICFRAVAVRENLSLVASSTSKLKVDLLIDTTDFLLNRQHEKCFLNWDKLINTRSNLSSAVLKEILLILGLDYSFYVTKEKLIDNVFLHYRNNIAHGKGMCPSLVELEDLYREILGMIEFFRNQIENAVIMEAYKLVN
jgi:hypothetical protein